MTFHSNDTQWKCDRCGFFNSAGSEDPLTCSKCLEPIGGNVRIMPSRIIRPQGKPVLLMTIEVDSTGQASFDAKDVMGNPVHPVQVANVLCGVLNGVLAGMMQPQRSIAPNGPTSETPQTSGDNGRTD